MSAFSVSMPVFAAVFLLVIMVGCQCSNKGKDVLEVVRTYDRSRLKVILESDPSAVKKMDREGYTALHYAVRFKDEEAARLLVAHGADVCTRTRLDGISPLDLAVEVGIVSLIGFFVDNGADVNDAEPNSRWTPLHFAAMEGPERATEVLLQRGADPNRQDREGRTPLHFAVVNWNIGAMQCLLQRGAEVNQQDKEGKTPLDRMEENYQKFAALLQKYGAKSHRDLLPRSVSDNIRK